ncbi:Aggrecan core protein [Holothuria leucospilota]|uniref:Aggrecan core protein n=1 Tax=Holothuria leucospilota TaxID=206669 RepID=A0A9Q1HGC8_HOLLE|nr:Aggrecan core protein [Holothuria leucospilota]
MPFKRSSDGKMWKEFFNFYLVVIISGLLYLMMFATCEPVCYKRISLDERNRYIQRVDCNGTEKICFRFDSRKDVKVDTLLHSPCAYPDDYPVTHEMDNEVITCSTTNLPTVTNGSFDCPPKSDVPKGNACNLTCKDGFYPAYSNQTVCETGRSDQGTEWSKENFECRECSEWNQWNGSEYKFISTRLTWNESRQLCESSSSHLVTIEGKEENEFVRKMVQNRSTDDSAWTGLNDIDAEGTWEWSDGTVSTYRNWREGQPNGEAPQDCVFMYGSNGKWHDHWCTYERHAVCETW